MMFFSPAPDVSPVWAETDAALMFAGDCLI